MSTYIKGGDGLKSDAETVLSCYIVVNSDIAKHDAGIAMDCLEKW